MTFCEYSNSRISYALGSTSTNVSITTVIPITCLFLGYRRHSHHQQGFQSPRGKGHKMHCQPNHRYPSLRRMAFTSSLSVSGTYKFSEPKEQVNRCYSAPFTSPSSVSVAQSHVHFQAGSFLYAKGLPVDTVLNVMFLNGEFGTCSTRHGNPPCDPDGT